MKQSGDDGTEIRSATGVLAWVLGSGIVLVGLAIATVNLLDRVVIEDAAAHNLHAEFLRATASVSRIVSNAGDIHDMAALHEAFQDIFELRPGIRRLDVFEVSADSRKLIHSSDPQHAPRGLTEEEWASVSEGRSVTHFDDSTRDRAWIITAPIRMRSRVVGALQGRYSLEKYDRLIRKERELAKVAAVGAVSITCLVFLGLIRIKVHRPINLLLQAMRQAESGDLQSRAPQIGPSDIRHVSCQFNRMLGRIRDEVTTKEHLLEQIQGLNDSLVARITEARSELQRTHMRLMEAQIQAERSEKLAALGELSAAVAHELGNPLNAISGHLQMLAQEVGPGHPERDWHLAIIRSEIDRMVGIIRHILDSTRMQVNSGPVGLNDMIGEILALLSPSLPSRQITAKTDFERPLPLIAGDRLALHGMLMNLALNALQAMPEGGELEMTTRLVSTEPLTGTVALEGTAALRTGAVRLTVRDTGTGIPPEHLESIFEPFFTTRRLEGGTGMGLAMCRRVVSASGGRLAVHSAVGSGTLFMIDLPLWGAASRHGATDGD